MAFRYNGVHKDELNSFERFPEGTYDFFIESIRETTNSYSGDPEVEIVLKPVDIEMQRYGKVWHRINLDNEWSMINIGRFLAAIGEDPERPGEIYFQCYEGEHLSAKIKHKSGKDGKTYVNALLNPRENKKQEQRKQGDDHRSNSASREYTPTQNLANEWDGQAGTGDDIPF